MESSKVFLLGVKYDNIKQNEALDKLFLLLKTKNKANLFFINADCLYKALNDQEYRRILNSSDLVLPDGIGLKLISIIFGIYMRENCNGTDFSPKLICAASNNSYKIFLLGGKKNIARQAADNMCLDIPGLKIVGTHTGFFRNDGDLIEEINSSGADILFVAMGVPLQEKWINCNRTKLNVRLCIGVGAFLDYVSDAIPRAPLWMRKIYLEWLWRIFIDPKRMFKRYIIDGAKLFWIVFKNKLFGYNVN